MGVSQFEQDLVAEQSALRRFAISLCRNITLADDLVQETMLRALAAQDSFDGANIAAWLFTICRNYYRSMYRKQLRREAELSDAVVDTMVADVPDPEQAVDSAITLQRLFKRLPEKDHKLVIMLTEERPYDELAVIMEVPDGTTKSRLSRFRVRARALVGREPPGLVVKRKPRRPDQINRPQSWWDSLRTRANGRRLAARRIEVKAARAKARADRLAAVAAQRGTDVADH